MSHTPKGSAEMAVEGHGRNDPPCMAPGGYYP